MRCPIQLIANDWMSDCLQVDAQLMRAPRLWLQRHSRSLRFDGYRGPVGERWLACDWVHFLARSVWPIRQQWQFDATRADKVTFNDCLITLGHHALREPRGQGALHGRVQREQKNSRSRLIQTMHNQRIRELFAHTAQRAIRFVLTATGNGEKS